MNSGLALAAPLARARRSCPLPAHLPRPYPQPGGLLPAPHPSSGTCTVHTTVDTLTNRARACQGGAHLPAKGPSMPVARPATAAPLRSPPAHTSDLRRRQSAFGRRPAQRGCRAHPDAASPKCGMTDRARPLDCCAPANAPAATQRNPVTRPRPLAPRPADMETARPARPRAPVDPAPGTGPALTVPLAPTTHAARRRARSTRLRGTPTSIPSCLRRAPVTHARLLPTAVGNGAGLQHMHVCFPPPRAAAPGRQQRQASGQGRSGPGCK